MTNNKLIDSSYVDINGNRVVWNDTVKNVVYYSTVGEAWDRYGGGKHSWYLENSLPNDLFYGSSLLSDKWSYFNYRGTVSGTVSNKLRLDIVEGEARGGITSENKWSLSGDFDIRMYLSEESYYNEYRGNSATGITISINENNKFRLSKYFNGSTIGYAQHYVCGSVPLKYFPWMNNGAIYEGANDNEVT